MKLKEIIRSDIEYKRPANLLSWSQGDVTNYPPSEKSYDPLITRVQLLDIVTFITFDPKWEFVAAIANLILYCLLTYNMFFDDSVDNSSSKKVVNTLCYLIVILDIIGGFIHHYWKDVAKRRVCRPRSKVLLSLDAISLLSIPIASLAVHWKLLNGVEVALIMFRHYRIYRYFQLMTIKTGVNTRLFLLLKHFLIFVFLLHTFACIWMYIGCLPPCKKDYITWIQKDTYLEHAKYKTRKVSLYVLCLLHVIGGITSVALGGGSSMKNDIEQLVLIILMFISMMYINGVCLGNFTSVHIELYRRQTQFTNKYKMIVSNLSCENASKILTDKMLKYYALFWKQEDGLGHSSMFQKLPLAIRQQVLLDKYWFALNQVNLFKNLHESFIRTIASCMTSRIYIPGEVIYDIGQPKSMMIYVAKGSVHLLSTVDGETPLLTLGIGSSIGKINLMFTVKSTTKVISATYSTIYMLTKRDLWRGVQTFHQLKQGKILHESVKNIIEYTKQTHQAASTSDFDSDTAEPFLQTIKHSLRTEAEVQFDYVSQFEGQNRAAKLSDGYILTQRTNIYSDDVFLCTRWPWILHSQSAFLDAWEIGVVITVITVAIGFPYEIAYSRAFGMGSWSSYRIIAQIVYITDIVFKIFTAVETEQGLLSTVVEISLNRLATPSFQLDILSILPLETCAMFFQLDKDNRILTIMAINRLLKIYRIVAYLQKLEYNFRLNIAYIRLIKYVFYLMYPAYILGSLYYMVLCFRTVCSQEMALGNRTENTYVVSIMTAMLIISGTGGLVLFHTIVEVVIILSFSLIGTVTFLYLVADYSATLTLAERERITYIEMTNVMKKFMVTNNMVKQIHGRINAYFLAKWLESRGMNHRELYKDAPKQLFEEFQVRKYAKLLTTCPIFQRLNYKVLKRVAIFCESIALPPNDYVTYAGEVSKEIYIVEKGYCELISGSSEMVEKILGPGTAFNVINTLLEVAGLYNVRTVTHVSLIRITLPAFREAFMSSPEIYNHLKTVCHDTRNSFAARRLFTQTGTVIKLIDIDNKEDSWFVFPRSIVHPRNIDYKQGWSSFTVFKYLMLKRTILPFGNFILTWEISRAVFAFLSAFIYPMLHIYLYYQPNFFWYALLLDGAGLVDIYIRLHVCYYDKKGILITHPRCTAVKYLSGSFIIDLLAIFPIDYAIQIIERTNLVNRAQAYLRLNKVLQAYRIPDAFNYFSQDALKEKGVILNVLRYLLITLILINVLSAVIINVTIEIIDLPNGTRTVSLDDSSWVVKSADSFSFNIKEPINIYVMGYLWVTTTALRLSFGSILASHNNEVVFVILVIVIGYLWFTYVTVVISNSKATINAHLTLYQNHMKQFIHFMRTEKISKDLQTQAINHFEYIWQRTHGMDAKMILKQCHLALRKDCALYLYEDTLKEIVIFKDMLSSFYRMLGSELNENYFLKNCPIIQVNDIVKYVYVIHKGDVTVIGPDGSYFDTLSRGCMFGNLDNVDCTRSMVTILSNTNVDLLTIKTNMFYLLCRDYPVVLNRLNKQLLLRNLSYVATSKKFSKVKSTSMHLFQAEHTVDKLATYLSSNLVQYIFVVLSLLSYLLITYQIAFKNHSSLVFTLTYLLDAAHVMKMYTGFRAPYLNAFGDAVTDQKLITKRYLSFGRFYLDFFAIIPTELISFVSAPEERIFVFTWLRINRTLRLWSIYHFFNVNYNFLNIKVLETKLVSIIINVVLVAHTEACIWHITGCIKECNVDGWMYTNKITSCSDPYLCSMYMSISNLSFSGYMNIRARTLPEASLTIFMAIINQLILSLIIGDMSAVAKSFSSNLTNFDYSRRKMELYLKHSSISVPLFKSVMNYTSQLWDMNQGYQIPMFIKQAPNYLAIQIKMAAYGYHILQNIIFMECHVDFLRLLVKRMKIQTYFTDDIICQQGDVNGTMYFLHQGNVNVYSMTNDEEVHIDSLLQNDCFGMIQGLFPDTPHTHTFKSTSVTIVLVLELNSWAHLLQFYPASKFKIYNKLENINSWSRDNL